MQWRRVRLYYSGSGAPKTDPALGTLGSQGLCTLFCPSMLPPLDEAAGEYTSKRNSSKEYERWCQVGLSRTPRADSGVPDDLTVLAQDRYIDGFNEVGSRLWSCGADASKVAGGCVLQQSNVSACAVLQLLRVRPCEVQHL